MRQVRHVEDCIKLQQLASQLGYTISIGDAEDLWEAHSDASAAGWLILDNELEMTSAIMNFVENK